MRQPFFIKTPLIIKNSADFIARQEKLNPDFLFDKNSYFGSAKSISGICKKCGTELILAPEFGWKHHQGCPYCDGRTRSKGPFYNNEVNSLNKVRKNRAFLLKKISTFNQTWIIDINQYYDRNSIIDGICKICGTKISKKSKGWAKHQSCETCRRNNIVEQLKKKFPFFDFSEFEYLGFEKKSTVICKTCGKIFQSSYNELKYCDWTECHHIKTGRTSIPEQEIISFLKQTGLEFETQKTFEGFKTKKGAFYRFDFYIPDLNLIIEYNGDQHYRPVQWSSYTSKKELLDSFKDGQLRDKQKERFCRDNDFIFLAINENYEKYSIEDFKKFIRSII